MPRRGPTSEKRGGEGAVEGGVVPVQIVPANRNVVTKAEVKGQARIYLPSVAEEAGMVAVANIANDDRSGGAVRVVGQAQKQAGEGIASTGEVRGKCGLSASESILAIGSREIETAWIGRRLK